MARRSPGVSSPPPWAALTILAIANRKGGSGKTTTAVNLAAGCAAAGIRTLLVDLDSQGHCALGLGLDPPPGRPTAHALLAAPETSLEAAILDSAWPGLDLIPAERDYEHGRAPADEQRLAGVLAHPFLAASYDLIILDTPPSFDRLMLNALAAAHWVLVPFMPHPLAAEGVRQLSRALFRVAMTSNARLKLLALLPIMLDRRVGQHREVLAQLGRQFGGDRLLAGIRADIKLAEAFAAGQPIRRYAPRSRGAQDYRAVLEAILTPLRTGDPDALVTPAMPSRDSQPTSTSGSAP